MRNLGPLSAHNLERLLQASKKKNRADCLFPNLGSQFTEGYSRYSREAAVSEELSRNRNAFQSLLPSPPAIQPPEQR